jgi:hypothetical protein
MFGKHVTNEMNHPLRRKTKMKKFFIAMLAVLFVAGAAYAGAPTMDFSGMVNTRGQYFSNDNGVTKDAGNYMIYDMEFDADLNIKPTDKTAVFLNFEIHDQSWITSPKDSGSYPGVSATTGTIVDGNGDDQTVVTGVKQGGADDQIAFKRLYGTYKWDSGANVQFGILTGGAWAYDFGDNANGEWRVKYTHPMPFGPLIFVLQKIYESGEAATSDYDAEADDSDLYAIATVTKVGDIFVKPLFVYVPVGHIEADEETDQTSVIFDLGVNGSLGAIGFETEFVYQSVTWSTDFPAKDYNVMGFYANVWTNLDAMKVGGQLAYGSWDDDAMTGFGFGEDYCPTIGGADAFPIGSDNGKGLSEYNAVTLLQAYLDYGLSDEMDLGGSFTYWMSNEKDTAWEKATGYELDVTFAYKLADNAKYSVGLAQGQISFDEGDDPDAFTRLYHKIQVNF